MHKYSWPIEILIIIYYKINSINILKLLFKEMSNSFQENTLKSNQENNDDSYDNDDFSE